MFLLFQIDNEKKISEKNHPSSMFTFEINDKTLSYFTIQNVLKLQFITVHLLLNL